MLIGDRLRAIRESKKLSQGDIETRTGLLRCYVSRVENGHTVPSHRDVREMDKGFGNSDVPTLLRRRKTRDRESCERNESYDQGITTGREFATFDCSNEGPRPKIDDGYGSQVSADIRKREAVRFQHSRSVEELHLPQLLPLCYMLVGLLGFGTHRASRLSLASSIGQVIST